MCELADRLEQFADRFVPQVERMTARLASSRRWEEVDPNHMDAVALRREIAKFDPQFTRMLGELVALTQEHEAPGLGVAYLGADADARRIAAAMSEITTAIKQCTREQERRVLLDARLGEASQDILTGSRRFDTA
jgi:hypothetical protein